MRPSALNGVLYVLYHGSNPRPVRERNFPFDCSSETAAGGRCGSRDDHPDRSQVGQTSTGSRRIPVESFRPDGAHAWLRLTPAKIVSWDFTKLSTLSST